MNLSPIFSGAGNTRRFFVKSAGWLFLMAVTGSWYLLIRRNLENSLEIRIRLTNNKVTFQDGVYLVNDQNGIRVFSAVCTHAGCNISDYQGDELVCSCHGSRYDLGTGKVIRGPALKDLTPLNFRVDTKSGEVIIHKPVV